MRIHRPVSFVVKQVTATMMRKIVFSSAGTAVIVVAVLFGQNILHSPLLAHADTPPESCFAYTTTSNQVTITNYYNNEGNNSANPACTLNVDIPATLGGNPVVIIGVNAFLDKNLTSITIPNGVTSIGNYAFRETTLTSVVIPEGVTSIGNQAFYRSKLTSAIIPNSVMTIGNNAFSQNELHSITIPSGLTSIAASTFSDNYLTSVTLPSGLTSIGSGAFSDNSIIEVHLPSGVTSVSPNAFSQENQWGRGIGDEIPGIPYMYSNDPAIVQQAYDTIWYTKLYTADPTNPHNIQDGIASEANTEWQDSNNNGTQTDSLGGHIVNPASATVNYLDKDGTVLSAPFQTIGTKSSDGTPLTNYLATPAGTFAPLNPDSPTGPEQTIMDTGFAQYNRIGQTKTFTAPVIAGYTLLSPASPAPTVLSAGDNIIDFHYAKTLTTVDFSTPSGSTTNPTPGSVPVGLSSTMLGSIFQVSTDKACSVISSAKLLPASSFTPPSSSDTTVGGLDFTLDCSQPGKDATVSLTLGKALSDTSLVKVYKKTTSGTVTDITSQVTIANQAIANGTKTVISYNLVDGGALDDDGVANGTISDPIYVVVSSTLAGELANTGENVFVYAGIGAMLMVVAAGGLVVGVRGMRRER